MLFSHGIEKLIPKGIFAQLDVAADDLRIGSGSHVARGDGESLAAPQHDNV